MKKQKSLLLVAAVLLLALVCVGGTAAWLTASTQTVTNTFTVGKIEMTLDEAKLGTTASERTETGNSYKLYPGAVLDKDPTVTVKEGSEPCYVFACVENGLVLAAEGTVGTLNLDTAHWTVLATKGTKTLVQYQKAASGNIVNAQNGVQRLEPIFTKVTIDGDKVTKENLPSLKDATILVNAYAYQSNAATQAEAIAGAKAQFGF